MAGNHSGYFTPIEEDPHPLYSHKVCKSLAYLTSSIFIILHNYMPLIIKSENYIVYISQRKVSFQYFLPLYYIMFLDRQIEYILSLVC